METSEQRAERSAVRRAEPRAGVPSRTGPVRAVAALDHVPEARLRYARCDVGIQLRLQQAERLAAALREPADQSGPQWCYRARAADDAGLPIDVDLITGLRVGVAGDVRHTPARRRNARIRLPARHGERRRDAAAGRSAAGAVVPHGLAAYGARAVERKPGAAAAEHVRAGGGEVAVRRAVRLVVARSVVPGGGQHGGPECDGVGARLVQRVAGLRGPGVLGTAPT